MDNTQVTVSWDAHTSTRFHHIWLRDHCRCPSCFHPITKQRLVNTFEIALDIEPLQVASTDEGLSVTWPGKEPHISIYPWSWLQLNSYYFPIPHEQSSHEKVLWGSNIRQAPPAVTYEEAMDPDDKGLYKWLSKIDQYGFCFVNGVPPTPEATEELSTRIGFIRETQYGKLWDFTSDLAKGDTAYTTMALGAHTDNTYFTDPCGIQLFHLLSHTEGTGGATLLVDGFYVADILGDTRPELYSLLCRTPVRAHAAGEPGALYVPSPSSGYPILSHDYGTGGIGQVRWNNDDRSVLMDIIIGDEMVDWYDAIRVWHKLLTSPDSEYWVQLSPGTVVAVNNHRVLHGRSAFDGKRRMCGAYIGIDEYRSKLTVLREKFETALPQGSQGRSIWHPYL
ncbi:Trimethyllysine dioxygenase [Heliocybe sulcata]|uniref:trimethyllysine dioxygenase n=1 Tax=Heliocybe sulcata TaxID=5364 RepID=A0A5C3MZA5_9AGAM|nr:Trimethyllysine dioxygenase [Heliocybe sulcata]